MAGGRTWVMVGVWAAGVGLATATGLLAVQTVAAQVRDPQVPVLREADVVRGLALAAEQRVADTSPGPVGSAPVARPSGPAGSAPAARPSGLASSAPAARPSGPASSAPVARPSGPAGSASATRLSGSGTPRPAPSRSSAVPLPDASASARAPSRSAPRSAPVTFRLSGGTVGALCSGTSIQLLYARPAPGHAVDQRQVSGRTLDVRFRGSSRSRLRADCRTGIPRATRNEGGDDGGGGDGVEDNGGGNRGRDSGGGGGLEDNGGRDDGNRGRDSGGGGNRGGDGGGDRSGGGD